MSMNQFVFNEIHPFKSDDKKWGYKKDNKIIIEPLYQGAMPFHDDICWVKQIAWGAIDIKKNNIIPFIYKHVNRLCPNRYLVCSFKNRYGIIDNCGNYIIGLKYDVITVVDTNILKLEIGREIEWCNFDGESICDSIKESIIGIGTYGFFTEFMLKSKSYVSHKEGGSFFVDKEYDYWTSNNNYIVFGGNYNESYEQWEILVYSAKGELVYTRKITETISDVIIVRGHLVLLNSSQDNENNVIFIDLKNHSERIIPKIKRISLLDQEYINFISSEEGKGFGLLNSSGDVVIPCDYSGMGESFFNNVVYGSYYDGIYIAATKDGEKCGIIDLSQNTVIPFKYTKIKESGISNIKSCLVLLDGLWGVLDLNNKFILECKYQELNKFYNNHSVAKIDKLYGVINEAGNTLIPFIYDSLKCLCNGYYIAQKDGNYYILDQYGNITLENQYDSIEYFYSKAVVRVKNWNHWGYVNMYGEETIPCLFITREYQSYLDNGMNLPCIVHEQSFQIDIDELKKICSYLQLEDLSSYSIAKMQSFGRTEYDGYEQYDEEDIIIEYQGYYIYSKAKDAEYIGEQKRSMSCVINPDGNIIYTSYRSTLSFISSDAHTIELEVENDYDYLNRERLVIDKSSKTIIENYTRVDDSDLLIVTKGFQHGVANNKKDILIPIEYNKITIIGKFVYAETSSNCILWHVNKGIIKQIFFDKRKDLYYQDYQISSISDNFVRFNKQYNSKYGIDMILKPSGDVLFYQIENINKFGGLYVISLMENVEHEMLIDEDDRYYLYNTSKHKKALFNDKLEPLYPDEFFECIVHCKEGLFIGNNRNNYVVFDIHGQKLFSTNYYDRIHDFHESLAIVERDGKYGVVDASGKEIVPCIHTQISDFKDGKASMEKYGTKIEIYKDGSMQKLLWGKVNDNVFCHIVNNKLLFVDEYDNVIDNYLSNKENDLLLVAYTEGSYQMYDEDIHDNIPGKLFFIDKSGLIKAHKPNNRLLRISSSCILYGADSLSNQYVSRNSLCHIGKECGYSQCHFITIDGLESEYLSSICEQYHFILQEGVYKMVDNNLHVLWEANAHLNIQSTGVDSFKLVCFSNYEEQSNHNDDNDYYQNDKTLIQVWDSETHHTKSAIASCSCYFDSEIVKFSNDGDYMIIPIIRHVGYSVKREELHLVVLDKDVNITIDEDFGYAKIKKIYTDKILLANFYTDIRESWNYYSEESSYDEITVNDGYTLMSLTGERLGEGRDSQYIIIEKAIREHSLYVDPSQYIRNGVLDLENDKEIIPPIYKRCIVKGYDEDVYVIVEDESEKLGLFYGAKKVLECKFKEIDFLTIHAEKKGDYDSPELELKTKYIRYKDDFDYEGIIYNGNIVHDLDNCKISGIDAVYSDYLEEGADFAIITYTDTMDVYHKETFIGTYKTCKVRMGKRDKDGCFLKLIDGNREGLIGENGCYIPLDHHKIRFDEYWGTDFHICVIGDRIYEKDGRTIYLGNNTESLIATYSNYIVCHAFWKNDEHCYRFYDKNKNLLEYKEEEHSLLGKIACIENLSEVVFSYEEKKFVESPYYEEPEEEQEDYYNEYDDTPSIYDNPYYNDNLDIDQQSIEFWNSL